MDEGITTMVAIEMMGMMIEIRDILLPMPAAMIEIVIMTMNMEGVGAAMVTMMTKGDITRVVGLHRVANPKPNYPQP